MKRSYCRFEKMYEYIYNRFFYGTYAFYKRLMSDSKRQVNRKMFSLILRLLAVVITLSAIFIWEGIYKVEDYLVYACSLILSVVVCIYYYIGKDLNRFYVLFEEYLGEFRYNFCNYKNVEDALIYSLDETDYIMMLHMKKIHYIITDSRSEEKLKEYIDKAVIPQFISFAAICSMAYRYGDKSIGGKSVFLDNLSYIKEQVNIEIMKRKKMDYLFSGIQLVVIGPLLFLKITENWAMGNVEEITQYYNGSINVWVTAAILLITIVICILLLHIKNEYVFEKREYALVSILADNRCINNILVYLIDKNYRVCKMINHAIVDLNMGCNVKEYIIDTWFRSIIIAALFELIMYQGGVRQSLILCISYIPIHFTIMILRTVSVLYRRHIFISKKEDEIMRIYTVLHMIVNMDNVSMEDITYTLYMYSYIYKDIFENVMLKMPYMGTNAIYVAFEENDVTELRHIASGLASCDKVCANVAFSNLEEDRKYYLYKYEQDMNMYVNNAGMFAKTIGFIPLSAVILFKLILPFVIEGISRLANYSQAFDKML